MSNLAGVRHTHLPRSLTQVILKKVSDRARRSALLDATVQNGKAPDYQAGNQATGCTYQKLANELRHDVSITAGVTVSRNTKGPHWEPWTQIVEF